MMNGIKSKAKTDLFKLKLKAGLNPSQLPGSLNLWVNKITFPHLPREQTVKTLAV